ncbi:MAG: hypothetical protein QGG09_13110, partial [Pirellulaceae bacterium]|nr:hypothetical protein [Pirellulaceae bacterium]
MTSGGGPNRRAADASTAPRGDGPAPADSVCGDSREGVTGRQVPVLLTIDTEEDNAWENHPNTGVSNVAQLVRLQGMLDKYGAKATCLVAYLVVRDDPSVEVLKELVAHGGAEIGAHLHPWKTPPYMESGIDTRYAI